LTAEKRQILAIKSILVLFALGLCVVTTRWHPDLTEPEREVLTHVHHVWRG
jgi:hypothetical protein